MEVELIAVNKPLPRRSATLAAPRGTRYCATPANPSGCPREASRTIDLGEICSQKSITCACTAGLLQPVL